jgi:predicted Rossmann fold nucleotide-binding protein DprA/Smf involved in DNA uptake
MTKVVFTGPEVISQGGYNLIRTVVEQLTEVDEFISGCANGVDTLTAMLAHLYHNKKNTLVVPRGRHNEELVYYFVCKQELLQDASTNVILMPEGPKSTNPHIFRDEHMVWLASDNLEENYVVAFPPSAKEQQRSGTWTTIRRARRVGLSIYIFPLDGSSPYREGPVRKDNR